MKRVCVLVALVLLPIFCFAQIPNAGFESWADDGSGNVNPTSWETTNSSPSVSVDSVRPGHSGTYAMRVKTVSEMSFTIPGAAILQTPITLLEQPAKFGVWLKSTIMMGDTALIILGLVKGDTVVAATDSCTFKISTSYATYTYVEFPLKYVSSKLPDTLYIMVATGLGLGGTVGTEVIVDDMAFVSGPTTVEQEKNLPEAFILEQNYPNPFNPETVINYRLSAVSKVSLRVFDLLGREVAVLVDGERPAGVHRTTWNAAGHPSGVYFCRLETGSAVQTRRMAVVR